MANDDGVITLPVPAYMDYGLTVFDCDSKKIGTIHNYDQVTGYMQVRSQPLSEHFLYIPYADITNIDPREVFISYTSEIAHRDYASPPPRATFVEPRTDTDTGEDDSLAITTEPSGYDGRQVVVDDTNVGQLAHHIAVGFHVYTSELEDMGRIQQYDREAGRMMVKRAGPSQETVTVLVDMVDSVDRDNRKVYLAVSAADLQRHPQVETWKGPEEPAVETQKAVVTEDIAHSIALNQTVYDNEGKKAGIVDDYDRQTGYVKVETNPFSEKYLYIPFRLITNIDPRELYVSLSRDDLYRDYADPPPHFTVVERTGEKEVATTTEPSGYDGGPVVVDQARIDQLKQRVVLGDRVFGSDLQELGTIKQLSAARESMVVERGLVSKHDLTVPVAVVDDVDTDRHAVYLAVSEADLERMQHR